MAFDVAVLLFTLFCIIVTILSYATRISELLVEAKSRNFTNLALDKVLKTRNYLHSANFPKATFLDVILLNKR